MKNQNRCSLNKPVLTTVTKMADYISAFTCETIKNFNEVISEKSPATPWQLDTNKSDSDVSVCPKVTPICRLLILHTFFWLYSTGPLFNLALSTSELCLQCYLTLNIIMASPQLRKESSALSIQLFYVATCLTDHYNWYINIYRYIL